MPFSGADPAAIELAPAATPVQLGWRPATVRIRPLGVISRMTDPDLVRPLLEVKKYPFPNATRYDGRSILASTAGPPSPEKPGTPVPRR